MKRLSFICWLAFLAVTTHAEDAAITINADHVLHQITPYLAGACIEDVNQEI